MCRWLLFYMPLLSVDLKRFGELGFLQDPCFAPEVAEFTIESIYRTFLEWHF